MILHNLTHRHLFAEGKPGTMQLCIPRGLGRWRRTVAMLAPYATSTYVLIPPAALKRVAMAKSPEEAMAIIRKVEAEYGTS